jgi:tetratricopeptide (TPR) repeat protein
MRVSAAGLTLIAWCAAAVGPCRAAAVDTPATVMEQVPMRAEFERHFAEQHDIIYAEGTSFSGSEVLASLRAIEELAKRIGATSPERARVLALMCDLQLRRPDYEDALALGEQSLAIQKVSGDLPAPAPLVLHEFMARAAQAVRDFPKAVTHFRAAVALSQADPGASANRRLALREALGRNLHEVGAYEEARSVNQAMLRDAEELFGAHDARLRSVLNNLAQNEYELHNPAAAKAYLDRRLQLARDTDQLDIELDTLFQLGVLAFEAGHEPEARRLMTERLDRAKARGSANDVTAAEEALAELNRRAADAAQ